MGCIVNDNTLKVVEYDMTRLSSDQLESLAISVKNEQEARREKVKRAKVDAIVEIRNAFSEVPLDDGLASPSDFAQAIADNPMKFYRIIAKFIEEAGIK